MGKYSRVIGKYVEAIQNMFESMNANSWIIAGGGNYANRSEWLFQVIKI